MKIHRNRSSRTIVAIALLALLTISTAAQDRASAQISLRDLPGTNPHALIGTWNSQATVTNCTGVPLQNSLKLVSFNQGGTAQEVSTGAPASQRTTALGVWEHAGLNTFHYALQFYRFAPDNSFIGSTRAKWTVTMGELNDSYTAEAQIEILNAAGTVVNNLCGTETAARFNP